MNAYYRVTQKLNELLQEDEDINTVTKGDISIVDLDKKNIYPLAHVSVTDAGFGPATIDFNVAVFAMDLRNTSKIQTTDKFVNNDNEDDNLNTMLYVLWRLAKKIEKLDTDFEITNVERAEPFTEARINVVDGWVLRFTIEVSEEEVGAC